MKKNLTFLIYALFIYGTQEKNKENLDISKLVCKFALDGWSRPTQVGTIKRFSPFFIFMAKIS